MAVPFGSLIPQRSRVLPQGGAVLGALTGTFAAGLDAGRQRAAEDEAPGLIMDYLDAQAAGYQPTLGSLAAPYPGGPSTAPRTNQPAGYNGAPTQANADMQAALTPGSQTFDGRVAMRRENASQQNPAPAPSSVISYNYGDGTIRNQPVSPELERALNNAAAAAGIDGVVINSGGQPAAGSGGARTGSTRHDDGGAADLQLIVGGRALDITNPNDLPLIQAFIAQAQANGATGFGAGTDYMGNNTLHVGFGAPGVWGAGGAGDAAPDWLRTAAGGGAATAGGGQRSSTPSAPQQGGWQPPTGQERALLRAMIINPVTREMGIQLATQRMMPPQPVQPNWQIQEHNGTLYRIDANSGRVEPLVQGAAGGADPEDIVTVNGQLVNRRTGEVVGDYRDPEPPAGPNFNDEEALRDNFRMETSDYRLVEGHYARLQAAAQEPSAAGDIAMVYAFMKMLDPGSVVRETEYATAQNAAGVPDIVRNLWNRVLSGERLGEDQRADFLTQAGNTFAATQNVYNQTVARYRDLATQYQMDPNRVLGIGGVVPPSVGAPAAPAPAAGAQPGNDYPRLPADEAAAAAAFNALPSGAFFYDPLGNLRQKP